MDVVVVTTDDIEFAGVVMVGAATTAGVWTEVFTGFVMKPGLLLARFLKAGELGEFALV